MAPPPPPAAVAPVARADALPGQAALRRPVAATLALLAAVASVALAITQLRDPLEALAPRYAVTEGQGATDPISAAKVLPAPGAVVGHAAEVPDVAADARPDRDAPAPMAVPPAPRLAPRQAASPRVPPAPLSATTAETDVAAFGPVVEARPPPAPVEVAVLAPPPPVRPPPDRWQRLADALARCPANDLLSRSVCEQSLRLEHCEGGWGRVASCPAQVERDYGN